MWFAKGIHEGTLGACCFLRQATLTMLRICDPVKCCEFVRVTHNTGITCLQAVSMAAAIPALS